ncbi:hypothetical protein DIC66_07135 [Rhodoferax lacus]|uniref:Uncharacterized protein n=1 Tax=Rhodoferax lacus TaxID=2184758 RepID=A0A3E1RE36_9BURK|nr:hypothetical protein [Rhodoferax lacus]RFO97629.1 hypothetical protein DIC66_07135 [Rhodoferax lacus]
MLAPFTEGAGLASTSPIPAHRVALDTLESGTDYREEALKQALSKASLGELKRSLQKQAESLNEGAAMRLSQEFTRRGIAPAFRGIPVRGDPWWRHPTEEVNFILVCADIEWLASRYPSHTTAWKRAQTAFDPKKLEATANYLCWNGREPGQIAIALGLSVDQQRQLARVQFTNVRRWVDQLHERLPFAESAIRREVESRPWKSKDPMEFTIKRRLALWHCAKLADDKPQRTADFYKMQTGESITRGIVAVQLVKLPTVRRSPL